MTIFHKDIYKHVLDIKIVAPDQECVSDQVVMLNGSCLCAELEQNQTVTVLQAQEYHAAPLCIQCVPCVYVGAVSVCG